MGRVTQPVIHHHGLSTHSRHTLFWFFLIIFYIFSVARCLQFAASISFPVCSCSLSHAFIESACPSPVLAVPSVMNSLLWKTIKHDDVTKIKITRSIEITKLQNKIHLRSHRYYYKQNRLIKISQKYITDVCLNQHLDGTISTSSRLKHRQWFLVAHFPYKRKRRHLRAPLSFGFTCGKIEFRTMRRAGHAPAGDFTLQQCCFANQGESQM